MFKDFRKYFRSKHPFMMSTFDDVVKKGNVIPKSIITPYITKESQERMIQVDVFSELMRERIIFFGDDVNSDTANIALSQLLYFHAIDKNAPATMYISTNGGSVYHGMALYDTMQLCEQDFDISTVCLGLAASMGSILMVGGTRGKRSALEHSRIMIHSVSTGSDRITYPDLAIMAKETETLNKELMQILADKSGKPYEEVCADASRDHWLKAEECLPGNYGQFGLIDEIITRLQ